MKKVLQKYWAWAFVVIPLLLQAIFFYVPMFQGAFYSFTNWTGLTYSLSEVHPWLRSGRGHSLSGSPAGIR